MDLPGISNLAPDCEPEVDEVTILSNNDGMKSGPKVVEIQRIKSTGSQDEPPKRKRRKKGEPQYLQTDEMARLFKVITSPRDRAMFRLMYHAGLRASEIGILELRDYNPRTERIHIERLKGSNSGDHHLCREESKAMRAWLKVRGNAPGPIFTSRKGGGIDRRMIWVLMRKYGALAMVPAKYRHPHVLKHSCATHLLEKGFHVEQVQDWIGHANIANTMIYAHITNARRDEMAKSLKDSWR
jgi:site-specific recombinase XerC